MEAEKIIEELPKGLLNWYDFKGGSEILVVQSSMKTSWIPAFLRERKFVVTEKSLLEVEQEIIEDKYDYVIAISVVEYCKNIKSFLAKMYGVLKYNGKLLLGMDNRLGIRYFCGDKDIFTQNNFDGVENYSRLSANDRLFLKGRAYSKFEIDKFLLEEDWNKCQFYSVFPNIDFPQIIISEDFIPNEELSVRVFPRYNNPDTVFIDERNLYDTLIKNELLHKMANGYLIECCKSNNYSEYMQVTVSMDRGNTDALATIIKSNGTVVKKPLYNAGEEKVDQLIENNLYLKKHGIDVIETIKENKYCKMKFIESEVAQVYLQKLIYKDKEKFIEKMDEFREIILQSSEHVKKDEELGIILKKAFVDLVPINCFYLNGRFTFFDQEFYIENYPANAIIFRVVNLIYTNSKEMEQVIPKEFFMKRYDLEINKGIYAQMDMKFMDKLRNRKELRAYNQKYGADLSTISTNRKRINYTEPLYKKIVMQPLDGIENKKIILFGSGAFANRFLSRFGTFCKVDFILDNNSDKWGKYLENIEICSPNVLHNYNSEQYKVIICLKDPVGAELQLRELGAKNISIYDGYADYSSLVNREVVTKCNEKEKTKPYHIGYIAGVFDLFHVGHLNMFKKAKEQCEYLIVGVVTDEGVLTHKKTEPFIRFEERLEMVRACRYVDEAVEIPFADGSTREAYRRYHFDCQFSGSDYCNDGDWLAEKEFLEKNGSSMVFFPYTESTSSTKIKAMINQKLL